MTAPANRNGRGPTRTALVPVKIEFSREEPARIANQALPPVDACDLSGTHPHPHPATRGPESAHGDGVVSREPVNTQPIVQLPKVGFSKRVVAGYPPNGAPILHRVKGCVSRLWWQHDGGEYACVDCHPPTHPAVIMVANTDQPIAIADWQSNPEIKIRIDDPQPHL